MGISMKNNGTDISVDIYQLGKKCILMLQVVRIVFYIL